ncbi:MAG TPA: MarP family serine protease [Nakamurella sp.]|nr:MarP family serine protease [Nakamurella sp.]
MELSGAAGGPVNVADLVIVLLLVGAAISGYRQGLVTAVLTLVGAIGGALVGIRVAPLLGDQVADSSARIAIGIALVVAGVGIGELAGQALGGFLTRRITWRPAMAVDRGLGLVGHTVAVLVVAWLIAVPLAAAPLPWLSSQIRSSAVLAGVNQVMPSSAVRVSGQLRALFVGRDFPQILDPLAPAPDTPVNPPDPALGGNGAAVDRQASILKIRAEAPSCSQRMEGSGFVVSDGVVVTNAHVVAGAASVQVESGSQNLSAVVVRYDPQVDLAVLDVAGLGAPPLRFADEPAVSGDDAIAAGYPLDGPFTLTPARVRAQISLRGPDIYSEHTVTRDVYTLRAKVRPGNSGGPLLAPDGSVLGVVFGAAIDNPDVGFALTAAEVQPVIAEGLEQDAPADTGTCTGG